MNRSLTAADWVAIAVALVVPSAVTWGYFIWLDGAAEGAVQTAFAVGKTAQFAWPAVWMLLVQRQRPKLAKPPGWSLVLGGGFGLTVAAAIALLYFAWLRPEGWFAGVADEIRAKLDSFGVHTLAAYLALAAFYSAVHSLLEEYYWRWFVFGQLARGCRLHTAIAAGSVGFAAHHVPVLGHYFGWTSPLAWLFSAGVAIGGAVWCWLFHRSSSLLPVWLSHALVDAAIFAIGWHVLQSG